MRGPCSDPSCPICDAGCQCGDCLAMEAKQEACTHYRVMPKFDEETWSAEAKVFGNNTEETRKRWPRFFGMCPDCGWSGIMYASYLHYVAGDW